MNIIIDGIEPQFKVYQMTEYIENKTYIGSTSYPLKCRMSGHRNSHNKVDMYFADVGWNNVIVQIIDTANNKDEMRKKENEHINNIRNASPTSLLNKNKAYMGMNRIEYARFSYANKREYYTNAGGREMEPSGHYGQQVLEEGGQERGASSRSSACT